MTEDEIIKAIRARVSEGRPTDYHLSEAPPGPASEEAIEGAEQVIGYPLPPLLLRIYREIANGGVGPFLGVQGITGGFASDGPDMIEIYLEQQKPDPEPGYPPPLPPGVAFLCDFGCAMWSLLDFRHPQGQMWWWESGDRTKLDLTLPQWFAAWLAGDIDRVREDPALMLSDEGWRQPFES